MTLDFEGLVARMKKVAKDTPAIHEIQDDIKDFVGEILVKQEKLHNEHAVSASNHFLRNKFIATLTDRAKQIVMVLPYDEQLQIRKDFHKYDAPPDAAFASATPVGAAAAGSSGSRWVIFKVQVLGQGPGVDSPK